MVVVIPKFFFWRAISIAVVAEMKAVLA